MTTTVHVRRDEAGWWIATSPDVPGMVTQARRLDQVEKRVAESIAVMREIPVASVGEVELAVHPDTEARDVVRHYRQARTEAERAQAALSAIAGDTARTLVSDAGYSMRDAAFFLGISFQRVQQLVVAANERAAKVAAAKKRAAQNAKRAPARKPAKRSKKRTG